MRKCFKYKLYESKKNKFLHEQIVIASNIYNHSIALHKRYYRLFSKSLSKYALQKHLSKLRNTRKQHWKKLGSQAIQEITDRIDKSYKAFFSSQKKRKDGQKTLFVAPPSFKKQRKYKSFTLKQAGYKFLEENKIKIGSNTYKYFKSREIEGNIKTLTVKRDLLGSLWLCISCEVLESFKPRVMTGKIAGFDFGLKTFLTPSDDTEPIESPLFYKKARKSLCKASKKLSNKNKQSNGRRKARIELARVHRKVANQRNDYHWKIAKKLSSTYDEISLEDLNMKGMQMLWGRKVGDLGFSDFVKILDYCCLKSGTKLNYVDRFFASSKICNQCGYKKNELSLRDRRWSCPDCGTSHDRDHPSVIL